MIRRVTTLMAFSQALGLLTGCMSQHADYGEPLKLNPLSTVSTAKVLSAPDDYNGKFVRVSGKVDSVCAARGCWMRLAGPTPADTLFVKFTCPVEGRLIPMEAVGHDAVVEGTLNVKEIPESEARHYKEDAGASADEIAKIVGPQKQVSIQSPAARIIGLTKEPTDAGS